MMRLRLVTAVLLLASLAACPKPESPADGLMRDGLDALYAKRDPARASAVFRRVLKASPDHYGATWHLAIALDRAGRRDEATAVWTRMLELATRASDANAVEAARRRLAPAAETDRHALWMQTGLRLLYEEHRAADAVNEFAMVLRENPEHYGANFQTARALDASGRRDSARPYWEKVLVLAERFRDASTADKARKRLAEN